MRFARPNVFYRSPAPRPTPLLKTGRWEEMAGVSAALGDFHAAMQYFESAATRAEGLGDLAGETYALNSIADLLHRQGGHAGALRLLDRALQVSRQVHDPIPQSMTLFNLARVKAGLVSRENALFDVRQSLDLGRKSSSRRREPRPAGFLHRVGARLARPRDPAAHPTP